MTRVIGGNSKPRTGTRQARKKTARGDKDQLQCHSPSEGEEGKQNHSVQKKSAKGRTMNDTKNPKYESQIPRRKSATLDDQSHKQRKTPQTPTNGRHTIAKKTNPKTQPTRTMTYTNRHYTVPNIITNVPVLRHLTE